MSRFASGLIGGSAEISVPGNDAFTKVLLHLDGANGSTSFVDNNAGGLSHGWSAVGSPVLTTSLKKYGSACLDCSSGWITTSDSADFAPGFSNFTVDFWLNRRGITGAQSIAGQTSTTTSTASWILSVNSLGQVTASMQMSSLTGVLAQSAASINDSLYHHIALVRNGSTFTLYIDGIAGAFPGSSSLALFDPSTPLSVGQAGSLTASAFTGLIDEFRYSVGIARWTGNFTPPTGPYI